jgi:hypothetical protein
MIFGGPAAIFATATPRDSKNVNGMRGRLDLRAKSVGRNMVFFPSATHLSLASHLFLVGSCSVKNVEISREKYR